jgi:hypothetical protein
MTKAKKKAAKKAQAPKKKAQKAEKLKVAPKKPAKKAAKKPAKKSPVTKQAEKSAGYPASDAHEDGNDVRGFALYDEMIAQGEGLDPGFSE